MIELNQCANPWLGLAPYSVSQSDLFFGRDRDISDICVNIEENTSTVIYGVSGSGKTSIINAGLIPRLSEAHYLPFTLRLQHDSSVSYGRQIIDACEIALSKAGAESECLTDTSQSLSDNDWLWLYFHTSRFWSSSNHRVIPVMFIDQFEELFTLSDGEEQVASFFELVRVLFSDVAPECVIRSMEDKGRSILFNINLGLRLVISIREDFLARLEDYSGDIPLLRRNRIGLKPLNGLQAMEVITKPSPGIVSREAALKIISRVSGMTDISEERLASITIDSSILSLFCSELFELACAKSYNTIVCELIDDSGDDILQSFYNSNMSRLSRRAKRYLEQNLITSGGWRKQLAVEDIDRKLLNEKQIAELASARIILKERVKGTERIEFTHDVLCRIARGSIQRKRNRQMDWKAYVRIILLCFLSILFAYCSAELISYSLWSIIRRGYSFDVVAGGLFWRLYILILILFAIPLCSDTVRYKWPSILLLFLCCALVPTHLMTHQILLIGILGTVSIRNFCHKESKKGGWKDYFSSLISLSALSERPSMKPILIRMTGLFMSAGIALEIHNFSGFFTGPVLPLALALFVAQLLFLSMTKFISWSFVCVQLLLSAAFLATQFSHLRWLSWLTLIVLVVFCLLSKCLTMHRSGKDMFGKGILFLASLLIYSYYLCGSCGFNIFSLKDNKRCFISSLDPLSVVIESRDGFYGLIEGRDILVPAEFESVKVISRERIYSDEVGDSRFITKFLKPSSRISIAAQRLSKDFIWDITCQVTKDKTQKWRVLEHPEYDNANLRKLVSRKNLYFGNADMCRVLSAYYWQDYLETGRYPKELDETAKHLFELYCNGRCTSDISTSELETALRKLMGTKAIHSESIRLDIHKSLEAKSRKDVVEEFDAYQRCLAILNLLDGRYDDALRLAEESLYRFDASPIGYVTLGEAVLLKDSKETGIPEYCAEVVDFDGDAYFVGELMLTELSGFVSEGTLKKVKSLLSDYLCPKEFSISIKAGSRIMRKINRGRSADVYIYEAGKLISTYEDIDHLNGDNFAIYRQDGKYGYINLKNASELTDAVFDKVWPFNLITGLGIVVKDGRLAFINTDGDIMVRTCIEMHGDHIMNMDFQFEEDGNFIYIDDEGLYGLLNTNGNWTVKPQYAWISKNVNGYRTFKDADTNFSGLMDSKGKILVNAKYYDISIGDGIAKLIIRRPDDELVSEEIVLP